MLGAALQLGVPWHPRPGSPGRARAAPGGPRLVKRSGGALGQRWFRAGFVVLSEKMPAGSLGPRPGRSGPPGGSRSLSAWLPASLESLVHCPGVL